MAASWTTHLCGTFIKSSNMATRTTTIGVTARFVPIIAGRVVAWNCWEPWTSRTRHWASTVVPKPEDIEVPEELRALWTRILGKPVCVTGYPDPFQAMEVTERVEMWAANATFAMLREFPVSVVQTWFATKDNCPLAGPPPRLNGNWTEEEIKGCHPFQYDDQVLKNGTEEAGVLHAAEWYRYFVTNARQANAKREKGKSEWFIEVTDDRIKKAAGVII